MTRTTPPNSAAPIAGGGTKPPLGVQLRDVLETANTPFRHVQDLLRFPISEARMRRRIREQLARGTPILVYSATKTASTAVAAALDRTVRRAQSMFHRVLVTWAGDVLELRRRDLLVPRWESSPTSAPCQDDWTEEPMKRVA